MSRQASDGSGQLSVVSALSEPDERSIRNYVNSQGRGDDPVTLVQQVGSRRIMGHGYELYDVCTARRLDGGLSPSRRTSTNRATSLRSSMPSSSTSA